MRWELFELDAVPDVNTARCANFVCVPRRRSRIRSRIRTELRTRVGGLGTRQSGGLLLRRAVR